MFPPGGFRPSVRRADNIRPYGIIFYLPPLPGFLWPSVLAGHTNWRQGNENNNQKVFRQRKTHINYSLFSLQYSFANPVPFLLTGDPSFGRIISAPTVNIPIQRTITREAHIICTANIMPKAHHVPPLRNVSFRTPVPFLHLLRTFPATVRTGSSAVQNAA